MNRQTWAAVGAAALSTALLLDAGPRAFDAGAPGETPAAQSAGANRGAQSLPARRPPAPGEVVRGTPGKSGLIRTSRSASTGFTLFAPLDSTTTYLVDLDGRLVHSWNSRYEPGHAVHLLPDGTLLRSARDPTQRYFRGGGLGGRVERLAPDGTVLWEFAYVDAEHCLHHDIEPLPNGNILMIAWEKKSHDEVLAAGREPELMESDEFWPDCIIEVRPEGAQGGTIVWEWHVWDHLVQDQFPGKPNFGNVAEHPERIDLNYRTRAPRESPAEIRRLRALGYIGGNDPDEDDDEEAPPHPAPRRRAAFDMRADWCHTNSVAYHPEFDQIALSVHNFNEVWIIDHSTTTAQAAGSTGGRHGRGGDLLYRWGNPRAYGAGDDADQQLFAQHDAHWIPAGLPGAGHLMVFNNGSGRRGQRYSSVLEIALPVDPSGHYAREPGEPFGPDRPAWEYTAPDRPDFFSAHLSGAERLPNGNTLICSGEQARIFEVSPSGEIVWDYVNPYEPRRPPARSNRPPAAATTNASTGRTPHPDHPTSRPDSGLALRPGPATRPASDPPSREPAHDAPPPDTGPRRRMQAQRPPPPLDRRPAELGPDGVLRPRRDPRHAGTDAGPPGGPPRGGGLFRATRLSPDHPGIMRLLGARARE